MLIQKFKIFPGQTDPVGCHCVTTVLEKVLLTVR